MGVKINKSFTVVLAAITLSFFVSTSNAYNPPKGPFATRFWDCCRSAFSHDSTRTRARYYAPVDTCEKDGVTLIPESKQMSGKNGCDDGGNQFVCNCIQPWLDTADSELAYGFGAYNIHDPDGTIENACYYVEFLPQDPNGKAMKVRKMILQNINTSQGLPKGSWDFNLAGGGVGDYNKGCSNQWGSDWGQRFGGVDNEQACCKLPEGLRSSCLFRFVYFGDNPGLASTPKRVRCPVGIIDRSGAQRQDDASIAPYSGTTDKTGHPAPDKYQRNRAVCQNIDPLGVVSSVCGGSGDGRLPKGYGMVRQDSPGAQVPDQSGSQPQPQPQPGRGAEGYGTAPDPSAGTGGADANTSAPQPHVPGAGGSVPQPGAQLGGAPDPNAAAGGSDAGNPGNGKPGADDAGKLDGAKGGQAGKNGSGSPGNGIPGIGGERPAFNMPGAGGPQAQAEGYGPAPDPNAVAGGGAGGSAPPGGPQPTMPDWLGGATQPGTPAGPLGALSRHLRRMCKTDQH